MAFCFVCVFDNVSSGRGSKNEREVWRVMCSESSWLLPRVPFLSCLFAGCSLHKSKNVSFRLNSWRGLQSFHPRGGFPPFFPIFFCAPQSRLQITIDIPLSSACSSNLGPRARCQWQWSVCQPPILGDVLHSAFINQMVQGGNIICPWSMFKLQTFVLNSFNNNLTEVIQTCCLRVLKNRTGPAPDLWPRSMMMQKAFYDGWVDAAARAAGLPPPAAGYLGMKFSRSRKRVQQKSWTRIAKRCFEDIYTVYICIPGLGEFQSGGCTAGSKYVDGFWTLQGQGL